MSTCSARARLAIRFSLWNLWCFRCSRIRMINFWSIRFWSIQLIDPNFILEKDRVACSFAFHIKQGSIQMHYKLVTNMTENLFQMSQNCHCIHIQMGVWQITRETHLLLVLCHHWITTRDRFSGHGAVVNGPWIESIRSWTKVQGPVKRTIPTLIPSNY